MNPTIKARIESIRRGEVPEGYKRTALGCYPLDWERLTLGSISERKGEYGLNAPACEYEEGLPKYLRITDIDEDGKYIDNGAYVKHIDSEKYVLRKGDLLFARTGASVGKNYLYDPSDGKLVFAGFLIKYHIKKGYNPYIVAAMCNIHQYNNWVHMMSARSGQPGINAEEYATYAFMLPKKLSEQEKIAEILAGQDRVIALKEELLAEKQKQKKYLMQQLLTGKKRLPGFSGEWKCVRLGELGCFYSGLSGKTKEDFGSGKPYIPYKNIFNNPKIDCDFFEYVKIKENEKQTKVRYGDIFFTTSSEILSEVGMTSVMLDSVEELYLNSFCTGFRLYDFNLIHPEYASHYFRGEEFRIALNKISQGITRFNLSKNGLSKISLTLPSIEEQLAIAQILSTVDKEIELLKKDIEQEKLKKKSLMQLLLTGIVRVL